MKFIVILGKIKFTFIVIIIYLLFKFKLVKIFSKKIINKYLSLLLLKIHFNYNLKIMYKCTI